MVDDSGVGDDGICAAAHVEAIRVVTCWETVTAIVWCIPIARVEVDVSEGGILHIRDTEAVNRPVLYVQVLNY